MTPHAQKTDSGIRREAILEQKTEHNEKTLGDLCDSFAKHLEEDRKLREKLSGVFGSMRFAAWAFAVVMPALVGVVSMIGKGIADDMRTQMRVQSDIKAKEINEIRERVVRLEGLHIGEKANGK